MSVQEVFTLPNQPSDGTVEFIPLGGDGFTSPIGFYQLRDIQLAGDASGGSAQFLVTMDDRYVSLVSFVTGQVVQATGADVDFRWFLSGTFIATVIESGTDVNPSSTLGDTPGHTWFPPPLLLPGGGAVGTATIRWPNVNTEIYDISAHIFLFNIRVREFTQLGPLFWSRGQSAT